MEFEASNGAVLNQLWSQMRAGHSAQMAKHWFCFVEVMGSNPVQAWNFFRL